MYPLSHMASRKKFMKGLVYWVDFVFAMTEKEIKTRYKQAFFGFLWIFLNPLIQMIIMGFVFQFFVPIKVDNYFLFLFSGLLPWNFFSGSFTKATPAFFYQRSIIKKARFPRESIVISIILSNFFHYLASLAVLLVFIFVASLFLNNSFNFSDQQIFFRTISLIIGSLVLLIFTCFLSLFTASLQVKYRDINFIVQAASSIWFYATPILYTLDLIPQSLHPLFYLNPLTPIVQLFQYSLLNMPLAINKYYFLSLGIILITIVLGFFTYKKENKNFDDWL